MAQGERPQGRLLDQESVDILRDVTRIVRGMDKPRGRYSQRFTDRPGLCFALGKTNASSTEGSTVGVSVWNGSSGGPTPADTTQDVSVYNWFGTIASGTKVAIAHTGAGWYIINAKCP